MRKSRFLLTPVLLWLSLFLIVPMLIVVGISFLSRDSLGNVVFSFSLEGYKTFLIHYIWASTGIPWYCRC